MSQERRKDDPDAAWNKPRRGRGGRKDTRRWCKGKPGVEHATVIAYPPNAYRNTCYWTRGFGPGEADPLFKCSHARLCQTCGKVLETWYFTKGTAMEGICPDWSPAPASLSG